MAHDFAGQTLIVIGGSSGIGKATAEAVLKQGGKAVLVGKRGDLGCGRRRDGRSQPVRLDYV